MIRVKPDLLRSPQPPAPRKTCDILRSVAETEMSFLPSLGGGRSTLLFFTRVCNYLQDPVLSLGVGKWDNFWVRNFSDKECEELGKGIKYPKIERR